MPTAFEHGQARRLVDAHRRSDLLDDISGAENAVPKAGENPLKQIHLGARLGDEIEFSDRTHRLDTAASVSALRDIVRGAFGPAGRDRLVETIRSANQRGMSKVQLSHATRVLPKLVQKSVVDAFESSDVINLPEGETAWRASNAISWVARHTEDAEVRLDLERAAGAVV